MKKKLIYFGFALVGLPMLSACGATGPTSSNGIGPPGCDRSNVLFCRNDAIQTGGYWFSYTDHVQWMIDNAAWDPETHIPSQGATINPLTSLAVGMQTVLDSERGHVIQVTGTTPAQPAPSDVIAGQWFDAYYQQASEYPNSLIPAYPVAGVGFGFLHYNAPFDPSFGGKYVGFTFDMKTQDNTVSVDAQLAVVCDSNNGNDLNDPQFSDGFPRPGCKYSKMTTVGEDLAAQGADYVAQQASDTCFLYEHKMFTHLPDNQWSTYCVLWNELTLPDWKGATAATPDWNDQTLQKCTTKLKWEMDKPQTGAMDSNFNVMLDNIQLITRAQVTDPARNCNVSALPIDSTKLIGQAPGSDGG